MFMLNIYLNIEDAKYYECLLHFIRIRIQNFVATTNLTENQKFIGTRKFTGIGAALHVYVQITATVD